MALGEALFPKDHPALCYELCDPTFEVTPHIHTNKGVFIVDVEVTPASRPAKCGAVKVLDRAPDYHCTLAAGHTGCHHDANVCESWTGPPLEGAAMTHESKVLVLAAFDALEKVASNGPALPRRTRGGHGGSVRCDVCGQARSSGLLHTCAIGKALAELGSLVPPFDERERWLAALPPPPETP